MKRGFVVERGHLHTRRNIQILHKCGTCDTGFCTSSGQEGCAQCCLFYLFIYLYGMLSSHVLAITIRQTLLIISHLHSYGLQRDKSWTLLNSAGSLGFPLNTYPGSHLRDVYIIILRCIIQGVLCPVYSESREYLLEVLAFRSAC